MAERGFALLPENAEYGDDEIYGELQIMMSSSLYRIERRHDATRN